MLSYQKQIFLSKTVNGIYRFFTRFTDFFADLPFLQGIYRFFLPFI
jgi:hypothetical protein